MKHFVTVRIPFNTKTPASARERCRKALTSSGFVNFEIVEPESLNPGDVDPDDLSDDCPECGRAPGECDPRCGQYRDNLDAELRKD